MTTWSIFAFAISRAMARTYDARWMCPRLRRKLAQPVNRLFRKRRKGTPSSDSRWRSEKWAILMGVPERGRRGSSGFRRAAEADPRGPGQGRRVARGRPDPHRAVLVGSAADHVEASAARPGLR